MAFKATLQQNNAIEASGGTLVSAAAGSGKTAVLAERVVRLLTKKNPISADRLLVVTFMNEAAEEMRSRIEQKLFEKINENPNNKYLLEQKFKIRNAEICTIDSFCLKLVREHFDILGVTPDFSVGDENTVGEIKEKVLLKIFNDKFEADTPEFKDLLNALCSKFDETDLKSAVYEIYKQSQNLPFPTFWLNDLINKISNNEFIDELINNSLLIVKNELLTAINYLKFALNSLANNSELIKFSSVINNDILIFEDVINFVEKRDWNSVKIKLNNASFDRWPSSKNITCDEVEVAKNLRQKARKIFTDLSGFVYSDEDVVKNDLIIQFSLAKKLLEIVLKFSNSFTAECVNNNVMTFSQAEHYALNLFCEYKDNSIVLTNTAQEIINNYDEVLVDEFQDVNDMQDLLFEIISSKGKRLFAVGDVKQSIYGFRGSNPDNFLDKKNKYLAFENSTEKDLKKIILGNNFRSRTGICEYINFLFSLIMNGSKSSIKYNEEEVLVPTAVYPENNSVETKIDFINLDSDLVGATETEAEHIANFIEDYINNEKVTNGTEFRKPKYSDFAIILRGVRSKGEIFAKHLKNRGIPVNFSAENALNTSEIKIMLSLLTVISNPTRDIELVSVLMSPIFNFTANELAEIRALNFKSNLISCVTAASLNGNKKCTQFLEQLNLYRSACVTLSLYDLIDYLYEKTEFLNIVSALENGQQRRENLILFLNYAIQYEQNNHTKNIIKFVEYINKLSTTENKAATKKSSENAVTISTIHKSKGLQYPVCILADLSKTFSAEDSRRNLITDFNLGVAFKYFNSEQNQKTESIYFKTIKKAMIARGYQEEMRLLYVALTRAKEKLLIVCSGKNIYDKLLDAANYSKYCNDLNDYRLFLENSSSYLNWFIYSSVIHPDFNIKGIINGFTLQSNSRCEFNLVNAENVFRNINNSNICEEHFENSQFAQEILNNINYSYPYEDIKSIESKTSVTGLAHKAEIKDFSFTAVPDFMSKHGLKPTKRGTATHRFMQFADFANAEISVSSELERLYEWEFLSESERNAVEIEDLEKFFNSDIYKRIKNAKRCEREMRFITEVKAGELNPDLSSLAFDETVVVQGSVDCAFEEEDGIVVLDFKTDRIKNESDLTDAYAEQLNIYAKACENIFEKNVKQLLIYSFSLNKTIEIPKK